MAERTRRTRRSRKVTVKEEPEEVVDEVEVEDVEETEDEVVEKPVRRQRRSRGKREVVKDEDDNEDEEIEELANEFVPPTVAEATFAEFMDQMPTNTTFLISKDKDDVLTFTKLDGNAPVVAGKKAGGGLRGKAYWDEVLSPDYVEFKEMWDSLTHAERVKQLKKEKIKWEEHDDDKVNAMRMFMAWQSAEGVEKYRPEYSTRAARDALKG